MDNLLYLLFIISIFFSAAAVLFYLITWLKAKVRVTEDGISHYRSGEALTRLDDTIKCSVISTNRTMADMLKKSGSFTQQDREEAFALTRRKISMLNDLEKLREFCAYIGNLDEWINNRIEYHMRKAKNRV